MKNILVTGGAGFIGSHLTEVLVKKGFNVIVIDNLKTGKLSNLKSIMKMKNFKFVKNDIRKKISIERYFKKIDIVFHLAAIAEIVPSIESPEDYFNTNVTGTLNILQLCKKNRIIKLIYTASSSCYGIPKKFPTKENEKIDPQYPYALTKHMGEELILHWSKVYKLNYISLRLFNVYGPKSRTSGTYGAVFGVFLAQKIAGKPFTVVGNGRQKRDFVYIDDVISCLIKSALSKINNQIFNVGSDCTYSINYLVKLLKGKKISIPKRPGEPDCTFADISKIKKQLKWKPKFALDTGVSKLLNNLSYWENAPIWNSTKIKSATKKWFEYLG